MVTSGTVNSNLDKFLSNMDDYSSNIESLSGSWKGASHDKLEEQATSFASRFKDSLENHFTTFAEACDLYKEYEEEKEAIEKLEVKRDDEYSSWQSAKNNDNDISAAWHHANYVSYRNDQKKKQEEILILNIVKILMMTNYIFHLKMDMYFQLKKVYLLQ